MVIVHVVAPISGSSLSLIVNFETILRRAFENTVIDNIIFYDKIGQ